ncbi:hypothetical protein BP6252_12966 [Coleophoma cylindrospora]|uniref:Major facilitator superfamily (MFS) profile domain-containing protein n=1 Tax=Coleophoma cylindrospora TaxID=1849047 RepID=A0A3D8QDI8_9HELO|nr:hypothetical protein BP6252_12966 [Coleophoma cylindrospora]
MKSTQTNLASKKATPCETVLESPSHAKRFEIQTNTAAETRLLRKIDVHLIPILFVMYLFAFLDRVNIGNVKIQGLLTDLQMTGTDFNIASMVLFVPYILLEVPSNIIMKKVRPSIWLSGLMFFWALTTICQGFVTSYGGLLVCRVFLGVFESGFFPGAVYLISMYYKRFELQKRLVLFFSSSLVAGAFGGLLAFALAKMQGLRGYNAWRWIFIIEGLATMVAAIASFFLVPDWPEQTKFLTSEEKDMLRSRLDLDQAAGVARMDTLNKHSLKLIFRDWKIWTGTIFYVCATTTGYSTAFFIPTILNEFGYSPSSAQLHTIPVYAVSFVLTLFCAWWSDRVQHRYTFTIGGLLLAVIGYIILLAQGSLHIQHRLPIGVRYAAIFFITAGNFITQPLVVVWLTNNLAGHYKRSFGAAIQIGIGNFGGIIGSNIYLPSESPYYKTGYSTGMALLLVGGLLSTIQFLGMRYENMKRDNGGRDYRFSLPEERLENLGDDHPHFRFNS